MTHNARTVLILLVVLGVLNFADWALTVTAIENYGATEMNPIMAPMFVKGAWVPLAFKAFILGVAGTWLWIFSRDEGAAAWGTALVVLAYALVVTSNIIQLVAT